jgi:glycerol-1-phosphate dehydrogenase [NAD(P)+]
MVAKLTAIEDWELSHEQTGEYISEYAAALNRTAADLVISSARSIKNLEKKGLKNLIEALVFSGIAVSIAGSSRPASGSEHLFSHALKILYPEKTSLHGEECAVGSIVCSYLHNMDWPRIIEALKIIGAPTNNEELKIPRDILIKALSEAKNIRNDRYTILDYKDIDEKKAEIAAKETGVIK